MVMQYYVPGAGTAPQAIANQPLWETIQRQQLDPYSAYRAAALGTFKPQGMYAPRFEQAAMRGFSPALGGYMLTQGAQPLYDETGGVSGDLPFSQYLAGLQRGGGVADNAAAAQNWMEYVRASRGYTGETGL